MRKTLLITIALGGRAGGRRDGDRRPGRHGAGERDPRLRPGAH